MSAVTPPPPPGPTAPTPVVTICPECHRRATEGAPALLRTAFFFALGVYLAVLVLNLPFPGRYAAFNHRNVRLDTWTGECVYSREGQNYTIMPWARGRETTVFEPDW